MATEYQHHQMDDDGAPPRDARPLPRDPRRDILRALNGLAARGYNWNGEGGLPLRPDARVTALHTFSDPDVLTDADLGHCPLPSLALAKEGTAELHFGPPDGRQLALSFKCDGVVAWARLFPGEGATVEGVLRSMPLNRAASAEFAGHFAWLVGSDL